MISPYLPPKKRLTRAVFPLLFALTVAGCGTVAPEARGPEPERESQAEGEQRSPVDELLVRASRANPEDAAGYFLEAAWLLWEEGDASSAEEVLGFIQTETLDAIHMEGIYLLQGEIASAKGEHGEVLDMLNQRNFPTLDRLSRAQRIRYMDLRAAAYAAGHDLRRGMAERLQLDRLLENDARGDNHEALWRMLAASDSVELEALAANVVNYEELGWLQLALVAQRWSDDLDRQLIELRRWREAWSRHPAASVMPREMEMAEILAQRRPQRIALLLPLQTPAGILVRDAFMSAYFNLLELGGQVPDLKLYDTGTGPDVLEVHRQARAEGAQLIIGPLLKQHVAQLQQETDLGVTTLALNNNEGQSVASEQLYQFALAPESEARQLAHRAWQDGHRTAAILSPFDDTGNDTFMRKRDSFVAEWQRLGGLVVAQEQYRDNFTEIISNMLLLNASNARMARLRELIGRPVLFVQRRRQDTDFIYLIAEPGPARQIVPSLAYLYAGDVPVYASQDLYSGIPRPLEDRDLNGIVFGDSPWILNQSGPLRGLFPASTARELRLQAFGLDAFRLYPRLQLLESSPEASMPGATGRLRLGSNRTIDRDLSWATIRDGLAQPVN